MLQYVQVDDFLILSRDKAVEFYSEYLKVDFNLFPTWID